MMVKKIEKAQLRSEIGELESILEDTPEQYAIGRFSLERRIDSLKESLAELEGTPEIYAEAALMFGGRPVLGCVGIEADFGTNALNDFQSVVDVMGSEHAHSGMGKRGPLKDKRSTQLHVTNTMRGSFGFELREISDGTEDMFQTELSKVVDKVMDIAVAAAEDEDEFDEAISEIDSRTLKKFGAFFERINKAEATVRMIVGEKEKDFSRADIEVATARATATSLEEETQEANVIFGGAFPDSHRFEIKKDSEIIKGPIDKEIPPSQLTQWNREFAGEECLVKWSVKKITRHNETKLKYRLLEISEIDED